jgi:hypothetical protein
VTLLQLHFLSVCLWAGLLAAETVMELHPRSVQAAGPIATIHKWIDLLFEGPIVLLVLITGGLLLASHWPAPPLLLAKVGLALVPIAANLYCIPLVLGRANTTDEDRARRLSRRIKMTGATIPFGIAAFIIGIAYLHPN